MKTLFISAKSKAKFKLPKFEKLPKNLAIAYSIQFQKQAQEIKKILEKNHKITFFNQVLGCSLLNFSQNTEGVLLIGQGKFHATGLAIETKLPVYILEQNKISKISKKEIEILSSDAGDEVNPLIETECPECRHGKAYYWSKQMRSGDEPETLFYKCEKCKHQWRDYR